MNLPAMLENAERNNVQSKPVPLAYCYYCFNSSWVYHHQIIPGTNAPYRHNKKRISKLYATLV
eukprot:5770807-Amphidinium_carterae.1